MLQANPKEVANFDLRYIVDDELDLSDLEVVEVNLVVDKG